MNYESILDGAIATIKALASSSMIKFLSAALVTIAFNKHAILFYAFVYLVFLDCFTRWMSISYKMLVSYGVEQPTTLEILQGIKYARSEGLISSDVMKHRFLGKIAVYLMCVMGAGSADLIMVMLDKPLWAVEIVVGYLTATELLSIIENLNDAGIEAVQGLYEIIKKKRG